MKININIIVFLIIGLLPVSVVGQQIKYGLTGDKNNITVQATPDFDNLGGTFNGGNVVILFPSTLQVNAINVTNITGSWAPSFSGIDFMGVKVFGFTSGSETNVAIANGDPIDLFTLTVDYSNVLSELDEVRLLDQVDHLTPSANSPDAELFGAGVSNSAAADVPDALRGSITSREVRGDLYSGNVGTTGFILPINLLSFSAQKAGPSSVQLDWTSAQEINSSHFEVERSEDTEEWSYLGTVDAAGDSYEPIDYGFLDREVNLKRNETKIFYYRLKQVDLDGFTEYSEIKGVRMEGRGYADISYFPNPTSDFLNIDIASDIEGGDVRYQIHDVAGKKIVDQVVDITVQRLHTVNLRDKGLDSGVYMVRVLHNSEIISADKVVLID